MSTAMAIAAAARVLSRLIDNRVALENITAFQNMKTSVVSPEQIDGTDMTANANVNPQVNIFPYHVGMNASFRNAFEPSRNSTGQPVTTPPLALDISFLVSAHSSVELLPEMLLGLAMQALSDAPQLTRDRVRTLLIADPPDDPVMMSLQRSGLADQLEIIRIEPLNLNTDDMQKLWTSIHSRARPSFCYRVSAILIDSQNSAKDALPVRTFATAVVQFVRPMIDHIEPANLLFAPVNQIALVGEQLVQPGGVAVFSTGDRQPLDAGSTPTRALVTLPAGLPAGIIGVELVRTIDIGAAPFKEVNESNLGVFLHRPIFKLTGASTPDIVLGAGGALAIRLQPPPNSGQDVRVLLNDPVPSPTSAGFTFPGTLGATLATDPVTFTLTGVPNGTYMVRVRVDGADTPLTLDANGAYTGPTITLA